MQSPPQRIAVTDYVQATRTALTTDLDVRGPFPNPLKDLELIPDAYWFSESGLWATNLRGAIMAPLSYVPQRLTSVTTRSTIYLKMGTGEFPRQVKNLASIPRRSISVVDVHPQNPL